MRRALLLAVVLLALGASGAQAAHRVHFAATTELTVWRSEKSMRADSAIRFWIIQAGKELAGRGFYSGECHFTLTLRTLTLIMSSCGDHPLTVRYAASRSFTLAYRLVGPGSTGPVH
jgi:hypothetical protein